MSAIAGQVRFDGRLFDAAGLERLLENLAYRGPDANGSWAEGQAWLGARLRWSTPESLHERQPLVDEESSLALVADARLDNRDDLIAALDLAGRPAGEITDGELLLDAFKKWGQASPEKLVGDFAFAIWDWRAGRLFCARDPMGLRPLYYHHATRCSFVFASQVRPLFHLPDVPRRLNERRIADHIGFLLEDRANTFYQQIYQLPAGHCLAVDESGLRLRRYWDLDPRHEIRLPSDEAYAEAFLEVFNEAVRCRLRSAYPAGSLLSGGLDSSSIVAVAREILQDQGDGRRLHTFSAIFPTLAKDYPKIDERPWIEAVVTQGDLQPHYVHADELDPLEAITFGADEPLPIPNFWLDWGCFQEAHRAGVRVILSGYDGDSAISYGSGYLAELALSLRWRTLLEEARNKAELQQETVRRVIKVEVFRTLAPPTVKRAWWRIRQRPMPSSFPFDPLIDPDFARRTDLHKRARQMNGDGFVRFKSAREFHRQSILSGLMLYGPELFDKAGAAWGLEVRLPFFDRRLLEFAVALPTRQKGHGGWNRYVVRRAMQGRLPPEVQWRQGKGDLSPNVRRGFVQNRAFLDEEIFHNLAPIGEFMDIAGIQTAYRRFLDAPMHSSDSDIFAILIAVTLAGWLRNAFSPDGRPQLSKELGRLPG